MLANNRLWLAQTLIRHRTNKILFTMPSIVQGNSQSRKVLILRIWQHPGQPPMMIAEVQCVNTGEIMHASSLEALLDLLRKLLSSTYQPSSLEKKDD